MGDSNIRVGEADKQKALPDRVLEFVGPWRCIRWLLIAIGSMVYFSYQRTLQSQDVQRANLTLRRENEQLRAKFESFGPDTVALVVDGQSLHFWKRISAFDCDIDDAGQRVYRFTAAQDPHGSQRNLVVTVNDWEGQTRAGTRKEFQAIPLQPKKPTYPYYR
jgi:hypothetical protein